jgi:hypothetical protein
MVNNTATTAARGDAICSKKKQSYRPRGALARLNRCLMPATSNVSETGRGVSVARTQVCAIACACAWFTAALTHTLHSQQCAQAFTPSQTPMIRNVVATSRFNTGVATRAE